LKEVAKPKTPGGKAKETKSKMELVQSLIFKRQKGSREVEGVW